MDYFPTQFTYHYNYTLTSVGTAAGLGSATVTENGSIFVNVIAPAGVVPEKIRFPPLVRTSAAFPPVLVPYVAGTSVRSDVCGLRHRVHGQCDELRKWDFSAGGSYIFTDPVNQTGPQFTSGNWRLRTSSAAVSYTANGTKVAPTFQSGYNLSQPTIPVPANDFSQRWSVLDGMGCGAAEGGGTCGAVPPFPCHPSRAPSK